MKKIMLAVFIFLTIGCESGPEKAQTPKTMSMEEILNGNHRSDKNRMRDASRHPAETLAFFEVKPNMSVMEISPGGGWYTEILGPYLKQGNLRLAIFSDNSKKGYRVRLNKKIKEKVANHAELFGPVTYSTFEAPTEITPLADANSQDRVLTFRNVHNWMGGGKIKDIFGEFYRVLKPGGILGIVEHRASSKVKQDPKAKSGYVRQDYVIALAKSAGFELVDSSEINANPKDTANHPRGVWTLPPSLALKSKDKMKYLDIGESDRMTLKFMKPKTMKK